MNRECAICNETKILNTCRAFTNCDVAVCFPCKVKASPNVSVSAKCLFCLTHDYYERIDMELRDDVFDCCGESSNIYVILKQQMKAFVCDEDFYNEYDFCYDCEEEEDSEE
jgi:hypothetical protein